MHQNMPPFFEVWSLKLMNSNFCLLPIPGGGACRFAHPLQISFSSWPLNSLCTSEVVLEWALWSSYMLRKVLFVIFLCLLPSFQQLIDGPIWHSCPGCCLWNSACFPVRHSTVVTSHFLVVLTRETYILTVYILAIPKCLSMSKHLWSRLFWCPLMKVYALFPLKG